MGLGQGLSRIWRKAVGSWSLDDARPYAEAAPYTFTLPLAEEIAALAPGDDVKLIFRGEPRGRWGAERMWVRITARDGEAFEGTLNNTPSDLPQIALGAAVRFEGWHVIDIEWADEAMYARFEKPDRDWVFGRCMVDAAVIEDGAPVGYLYRETPDLGGEDDAYPDTGWRIRAQRGPGETDADLDRRESLYVAIGLVLNGDPSLEPLIAAPIGARFAKGPDGAWAPA
jgi:hypothetical protein